MYYDGVMYKKFKYEIIAFAVSTILFYGWLALSGIWLSLTDQAAFLFMVAVTITGASYVYRISQEEPDVRE